MKFFWIAPTKLRLRCILAPTFDAKITSSLISRRSLFLSLLFIRSTTLANERNGSWASSWSFFLTFSATAEGYTNVKENDRGDFAQRNLTVLARLQL